MSIQVETEGWVIYDVVFVPKFQFPSARKAVCVQLSSLLTLAKLDKQWKVPTLCTFGMEAPLASTYLVEIYVG